MAIFRLDIKSIGRSEGRHATAAAAYRSGERIRDERTGQVFNYSRRNDVIHKEILLPQELAEQPMEWARDRVRLWNAAEQAETRKNARVARELQIGLPPELSAEDRLKLARAFSQEISDRYRVAVDLAVHAPRTGSDPRNHHAHLLLTTREATPAGLGGKAGIDLSAAEREKRRLPSHSSEYIALRERWATVANETLRAANIDARIDHRSLSAQGLDRQPQHVPLPALHQERRGGHNSIAERVRANHLAREQARVQDRPESSVRSSAAGPIPPSPAQPPTQHPPQTALTLAQIRRRAREAWLELRAAQTAGSDTTRSAQVERPVERAMVQPPQVPQATPDPARAQVSSAADRHGADDDYTP
ncbi:MAG TPA: MobQ family relaxase [Steroidobacteraceae bacterium]|nr:MobQ family relaxase [Steroidobacteraceae bacterium]